MFDFGIMQRAGQNVAPCRNTSSRGTICRGVGGTARGSEPGHGFLRIRREGPEPWVHSQRATLPAPEHVERRHEIQAGRGGQDKASIFKQSLSGLRRATEMSPRVQWMLAPGPGFRGAAEKSRSERGAPRRGPVRSRRGRGEGRGARKSSVFVRWNRVGRTLSPRAA